jgi:2-aminoadipate transaminase
MDFYISQKMKDMKPSAIREFFKYAADPGVISMAAGNPCPEALPLASIRKAMQDIMAKDIEKALVYNISEGYPPLREALKSYLRDTYNSFTDDDDLIVFSGAQQCMDIVTKVLCDEGDAVICEDPSFTGSLNTFRAYGVKPFGVPINESGINLELLEKALNEQKNVRFIYVIPNFQNPTGYTMTLETRKGVYALAKKYGVPILEDDPYGDLRFAGENIPTIKSMDTDGIVLYARSFSKVLAAGIRVGYLAFPKSLAGMLTVGKQSSDVHTSMMAQLLAHRFLTEHDIGAHISSIKEIYRRKCGLLLGELSKLPEDKIKFSRPQGGLFVWANLLKIADSSDFIMRLVKEKKVAMVPGSAFFAQSTVSGAFRMTFAAPSDQQIVTGIGKLSELMQEY